MNDSLPELVSVLDVSDDDRQFYAYLGELHRSGVWVSQQERLQDAARRVMDSGYTPPQRPPAGPGWDQWWTLPRRRLLVAMTWSTLPSEREFVRLPAFEMDRVHGSRMSALTPRDHLDLRRDVRDRFKYVLGAAQRLGYNGDVLRDAAQFGLIERRLGVPRATWVAAELVNDSPHWDQGYLLTCDDVVEFATGLRLSFEPTADHPDGLLNIDWEELFAALERGNLIHQVRTNVPRQVEAEIAKLQDEDHGPLALHARITAAGLISEPRVGTKYRKLFEHLDSQNRQVQLDRDEISELVRLDDEDRKSHRVRGATGAEALPRSVDTRRWWYGPSWDPDRPSWSKSKPGVLADETRSAIAEGLDKRSWTRAWTATGMRAKPTFKHGQLERVDFIPFASRAGWWRYRRAARDGTLADMRALL